MWSGCAEGGDDVLDFVCGQGAVYLIGDDGVGVHDVLGDGFDLFHVAGEAAGVDDMSMPKFMRGCVGHAQFFTEHFDIVADDAVAGLNGTAGFVDLHAVMI